MAPMEKRTTLIIGLAIPVVMMLFVAGSIYLPRLFVKPNFSFIYSDFYDGPYNISSPRYVVDKDGKLALVEATAEEKRQAEEFNKSIPIPVRKSDIPVVTLYKYDVTTDTATKITLEDAQKFTLDPSSRSPDGFELVYGRGGGDFFPFFYNGGDYNARYLSGHNTSRKLNLTYLASSPNYPYQQVAFLGWIIK